MTDSTKTYQWHTSELIDGKYYYSIEGKTIIDMYLPGGVKKEVSIQTDRYIQTADGKAYRAPRVLRKYG